MVMGLKSLKARSLTIERITPQANTWNLEKTIIPDQYFIVISENKETNNKKITNNNFLSKYL
jgi:hypothetical protein